MSMLTKNDFLATDWTTFQEVPHLVGLAALVAGASGLGTIKESVALAQGIMEGQSSEVPLIRDLSNRVTMQEAQRSVRDAVGALDAKASKDRLKGMALEGVAAMMSMLDEKGSAEEVSAVRQWLYQIAEKVAKSAKEGGVLGFGGTQVSEGEQAFLAELRTALGLEVGTA
jgi:hypothetical protein